MVVDEGIVGVWEARLGAFDDLRGGVEARGHVFVVE